MFPGNPRLQPWASQPGNKKTGFSPWGMLLIPPRRTRSPILPECVRYDKHIVPVIPVNTPSATYDVTIASGLLRTLLPRLEKLNQGKPFRPFVVTSPDIWGLWSKHFLASFKESPIVLFLPAGERHKRMASVESLA